MLRKLCLVALLLAAPLALRADAPEWAIRISVNQRVVVSSTSATTLVSPDPYAKKTCLLNATTDYLLIGDFDTTFSTSASTGTFRLAGTTASAQPQWSCFDGPGIPYKGGLKARANGSGTVTVDVIREQ